MQEIRWRLLQEPCETPTILCPKPRPLSRLIFSSWNFAKHVPTWNTQCPLWDFPVTGTPSMTPETPRHTSICALKAPFVLVSGPSVTGGSRALCMKSLIQCPPLYRAESPARKGLRQASGSVPAPLLPVPLPATALPSSCQWTSPSSLGGLITSLPTWFG